MISTGSLLLGIALLLIVGVIVIRPLLSPTSGEATFAHAADPVTMKQALEAQKDALLEQIRDLDFDHETGKVPEDRYRERRAKLTAEAADIFRKLDTLTPAADGTAQADRKRGDDGDEDEIEAAVARLRKRPDGNGTRSNAESVADGSVGSAEEDAEAEIEAAIARLRSRPDGDGARAQVNAETTSAASRATGNQSRFCPQCGEPHDPGDKFCAYCGHGLN